MPNAKPTCLAKCSQVPLPVALLCPVGTVSVIVILGFSAHVNTISFVSNVFPVVVFKLPYVVTLSHYAFQFCITGGGSVCVSLDP